jgi:tRNA(Ile)-lysidine synthase
MLDRVQAFLDRYGSSPPGPRILVGISGGVDSVVLLHGLCRLGVECGGVHVNYGLRGADAEGDEAFVRNLCEQMGVPLQVKRCTKADWPPDTSVQDGARRIRYAFFATLATDGGFDHVAVAHHREDQAETLLLHLFRGSGLEGLAAMPPERPLEPGSSVMLLRPLLDVSRAEIEAYARREGLAWRTDAGNRNPAYRRTIVRETLLPLVEAHFPGATAHLAGAATRLRGYLETTFADELEGRWAACAATTSGGDSLLLAPLAAQPPVWQGRLVLEALARWLPAVPRSAAATAAVGALLPSQPGRKVVWPQGIVWRERDRLVFQLPSAPPEGRAIPLNPGDQAATPGGMVSVTLALEHPLALDAGAPARVFADADRLTWPLTLRPWQQGDTLSPLGMQGHKRVSDLLTDRKVPASERAQVYVLCSGPEVVWVVGHRLSETVRVRPETTRVAVFQREDDDTGETPYLESTVYDSPPLP